MEIVKEQNIEAIKIKEVRKISNVTSQSQEELPMDVEEYNLVKRLPLKCSRRKNDIYVSRKTDFCAQINRCKKLLETGKFDEIFIHGLGYAVERAINLALRLKKDSSGGLNLYPTTDTMQLIDDFEPVNPRKDQIEIESQTRSTSVIHIKVFKTIPSVKLLNSVTMGSVNEVGEYQKTDNNRNTINRLNKNKTYNDFWNTDSQNRKNKKRKASNKPI